MTGPIVDYTVPDGTYQAVIAEVRGGTNTAGDERWALRLVVTEGPHAGKHAAWDSLIFSIRGRARARQVLRALGFRAKDDVKPGDLEGRKATVQLRAAEYTSPAGAIVRRSEIPYDGWGDARLGVLLHGDGSRAEKRAV